MALTATAQPNSFPQSTGWFVTLEPHWRTQYPDRPASKLEQPKGQASSNALPAEARSADLKVERPGGAVLNAESGGLDSQLYYRQPRGFGFSAPAYVSEDPLARLADSTFQPEVFHIGKTFNVSCSLSTAIKHKNPLCLLNTWFLNVSW
jgi:hypothetical protein